jgi:2-hydroxy-4-carboxymuconate semialdehyde hemiacetal dehydrogenase
MSTRLKAANDAICTLSLSFDNDGPLGTFFRYMGDTATHFARYDEPLRRQGRKARLQQGRRVGERHRTAGPRILCR